MVDIDLNLPKTIPWEGSANNYFYHTEANIRGKPESKFKMTIKMHIVAGGNFLCGTSTVSDFYIQGSFFNKPGEMICSQINKRGFPEEFYTEFKVPGALGLKKKSRKWKKGINGILQREVWNNQEVLLKSLLPKIISFLNAENTCILLGGRVTEFMGGMGEDPDGNYWSVKSPEFAKYLIENQIGVVTASHVHQNRNHEGQNGMPHSCYQYWIWTHVSDEVAPRVASVGGGRCGVFSKGVPNARRKYLEYWSKECKVSRRDRKFKIRYDINKS